MIRNSVERTHIWRCRGAAFPWKARGHIQPDSTRLRKKAAITRRRQSWQAGIGDLARLKDLTSSSEFSFGSNSKIIHCNEEVVQALKYINCARGRQTARRTAAGKGAFPESQNAKKGWAFDIARGQVTSKFWLKLYEGKITARPCRRRKNALRQARHVPCSVVGDSVHTVGELVMTENQINARRRLKNH